MSGSKPIKVNELEFEMAQAMVGLLGSGYVNEHYVNCAADFVSVAESFVDPLKQRIKELEQERGRFHQYRAEAVMMRKMLLGKDVNAVDVSPNDLKDALEKRDLEQQAKGLEMASEMCDSFAWGWDGDCAFGRELDKKADELHQQAEDLK